jgi:hypothetical protein
MSKPAARVVTASDISRVGFEFGEIKPLSASGERADAKADLQMGIHAATSAVNYI